MERLCRKNTSKIPSFIDSGKREAILNNVRIGH